MDMNMKRVYEFTCPLNLMRQQAKNIQVEFIHEIASLLKIRAVSPILWWYVKAKIRKYVGVSMCLIAEDAIIIFRSLPNALPPYVRLIIDTYGQTENFLLDKPVEDLITSRFKASMIRDVGTSK